MSTSNRILLRGARSADTDLILTPEALNFLADLHDRFAGPRHVRLWARQESRATIDNGRNLNFLPETAAIRADPTWRVAGPGPGLEDRRVEITGPIDPKLAINALNSGAKVWLADLEDATSPTWANIIGGQATLYRAIRGTLDHVDPATGRRYTVGDSTPTIVLRPRGWHLVERHLSLTDPAGMRVPAVGALVDAGLYLFHNAHALIAAGRGPYLYLPKLENHLEARLWNEVFEYTEAALGLEPGTIRATVLIETIGAAFEMEEILYELREHCAGLNAGRWDYIFSLIKTHRERGVRFVLPDRALVTMDVPFLRDYSNLLVATCHRRGASAIGGMSAFIPSRHDPVANERAFAAVRADKAREAAAGFDGTWVAHPGLVSIARAEFDAVLGSRPDQRSRLRPDVSVSASDLLNLDGLTGEVTEAGVRGNIRAAVHYLESWLRGRGAVAIDNLMEDAATAEIARAQLWQWVRYRVRTSSGETISPALIREGIAAEVGAGSALPGNRFAEAAALIEESVLGEEFPTFITLSAYRQYLVEEVPLAAIEA
ncbi:malate synthase A [Mycetocola saprophilus]|uniref:malate synthase A n=1 Tax=Mycetocola saprophilus TaxID=76636 RepID=UPI003BF20B30